MPFLHLLHSSYFSQRISSCSMEIPSRHLVLLPTTTNLRSELLPGLFPIPLQPPMAEIRPAGALPSSPSPEIQPQDLTRATPPTGVLPRPTPSSPHFDLPSPMDAGESFIRGSRPPWLLPSPAPDSCIAYVQPRTRSRHHLLRAASPYRSPIPAVALLCSSSPPLPLFRGSTSSLSSDRAALSSSIPRPLAELSSPPPWLPSICFAMAGCKFPPSSSSVQSSKPKLLPPHGIAVA